MSKKWYYVLAILLAACSWIGNVWYYEANQLGRTVFLEHHVETREGEAAYSTCIMWRTNKQIRG